MTKHVPPPTDLVTGPVDHRALFDRIAAGAAERDRDRKHPYEAIEWLKEARLGALRLPKEAGGQGVSIRDLIAEVIALGAADPNVAHILRNHFVFVERFARRPRSAFEESLQRHVAAGAIFGLAAGELGNAITSSAAMESRLTADGDGYRLNGLKYYSTGSLYADFILVRAKIDADTLASAIIPSDREGLELVDDWDGFGQRLTGTGTTRLGNIRVEADEVIIDTDEAAYRQPHNMVLPQLFLTAVIAGILRNVVQDAAVLVKSRGRNFIHGASATPSEDPLLQQVVGEISALAFAGEATVLAAADAFERVVASAENGRTDETLAHDASLAAAKAKIILDSITTKAAGLLLDVGGASATKQDKGLDRHWRNARTLASHNPRIYKAQAVGALEINGTPLPRTGFF